LSEQDLYGLELMVGVVWKKTGILHIVLISTVSNFKSNFKYH